MSGVVASCPLGSSRTPRRRGGPGAIEDRTDLPAKKTARVLIYLYRRRLVVLHGFITKTRATPDSDLATARKRRKEVER